MKSSAYLKALNQYSAYLTDRIENREKELKAYESKSSQKSDSYRVIEMVNLELQALGSVRGKLYELFPELNPKPRASQIFQRESKKVSN